MAMAFVVAMVANPPDYTDARAALIDRLSRRGLLPAGYQEP
jgi:hypothetical protein